MTTADTNRIANPGFEGGWDGWAFGARNPDSASATLVTTGNCHSGSQCLQVVSEASTDWAVWGIRTPVPVVPGEVWQWSAWVRVDSIPGAADLGFVTRDSTGAALDWRAATSTLRTVGSGWWQVVSRIAVPAGCATLLPRISGYGHCSFRFDDLDFHRQDTVPSTPQNWQVSTDSVLLRFGAGLSMVVVDRLSGDSSVFAGSSDLHVDSSSSRGDSLLLHLTHLPSSGKIELLARARGGAVNLRLTADSSMPLATDLGFPGLPQVKPGQYYLMPRGTGLAVPVDGPLPATWGLRNSEYWAWQVTQGIGGLTDGRTGFLVDFDEPWNARQYIVQSATSSLLQPMFYLAAAKGVWGHSRSLQISPLRGGGFAEVGLRHRAHLGELKRVRSWAEKIALNPNVGKLRGAADVWIIGVWPKNLSGWFDTLRLLGLEHALVNLGTGTASIADANSIAANGFLASTYDDYSDAYPTGSGRQSLAYPAGAVVNSDGSLKNGWFSSYDSLQALEICPSLHPGLAKTIVAGDSVTGRNARFVDVELSMQVECWSKDHPLDRDGDARYRTATFALVKDSFHNVVGSEEHRDWASAVVDWGEGSMSIASVASAGSGWSLLKPPEPNMDTLSMSAKWRVPLLPLATHDGFAPTWYTGDGQSKVPLRWNQKDAWNALYATMPLIMPTDRKMWDSLESRYLRSVNLLCPLHERVGFLAMKDFAWLSSDHQVQRTTFDSAWTVEANFDSVDRTEGSVPLPPAGFVATDGTARIERSYLNGAVRSRVRGPDLWFLDPEGSEAEVDGVRTSGGLRLKRLNSHLVLLSFVGTQQTVDLSPSGFPWVTDGFTARVRGGEAVPMTNIGSGWSRLVRVPGARFYELSGDFGVLRQNSVTGNSSPRSISLVRSGNLWVCSWVQDMEGAVRFELLTSNGRRLARGSTTGVAGKNQLNISGDPGIVKVRLKTDQGAGTLQAIGF